MNQMPHRKHRGAALIEAALTIPVLLLLIGVTYELGAVFQQYLLMQQIAYEGARAGSQLSVGPGELQQSCYENNTSAVMRRGSSPLPPTANSALMTLLQRVDSLMTQHAGDLSVGCNIQDVPNLRCSSQDSNTGRYKCCLPQNNGRPSFAAEYINLRALSLPNGPQSVCGYQHQSAGNPGRGDTVVEGTVGVTVSGHYEGRVFPFTLTLSAESRASVLSNQDFSTGVGNAINKIAEVQHEFQQLPGGGMEPGGGGALIGPPL